MATDRSPDEARTTAPAARPDALHLVCSVGTAPYQETTYCHGDQRYRTRFAPVAVARLRRLAGGRASVLVTEEAHQHANYRDLAAELAAAGLAVGPVPVPAGRDEAEILDGFDRLVAAVGAGDTVVLDVTFALRHLPFVYLAALTYLTTWQDVTIAGIYYGAWELRNAVDEAPLLDVTTLFRLTRWYHAVQTAEDSGDLRPLASVLRADADRQRLALGQPDRLLSRMKDRAAPLSQALGAGLPLEIGRDARRLVDALAAPDDVGTRTALHRLALERLEQWAAPLASASRQGAKTAAPLDLEELARQLRLAEWYAARGDVPKVLLLLREWLVSRLVLSHGDPTRWLERGPRQQAERRLVGLSRRARARLATRAERRVADPWDALADPRNAHAHAGMREQWVGSPALEKLLAGCRDLLAPDALAALPEPTGGTLLVSPLGLSPGLLYSAVRRVVPAALLLVTSREGRGRLDEALQEAGGAPVPVVREMDDPHAGFGEATHLVDDQVRRLLVASRAVVVNLTGGTTVMQYVVERIGAEAASLSVPVRRVALVDRRPPEEQRAAPYAVGELVELNDEAPEPDAP